MLNFQTKNTKFLILSFLFIVKIKTPQKMYGVRLDDQKVFLNTNPLTIVVSVYIFLSFIKIQMKISKIIILR